MLRAFIDCYRPYKGLFWLDFSCAVLSGMLELAFPLAITLFVDHLLPLGDWSLTLIAALGLTLIYLLNSGLMIVVMYWGHKLGINIETDLRARAFAHLTRLSWGWYDKAETGKLVARVTRDLEEIGEVAHHGPEDLFIAIMTFVGAIALMMWIHPGLALVTIAVVPIMVWLISVYGGRMTRTWQAIYGRVGAFNVRLEEALGGIRIVQAFTNERHEHGLFAQANAGYRRTKLDAYRIMAKVTALQYAGLRAVQVLVMVVGAAFVMQGSLSTGGFVGFLLLVSVFFRPLEKIAAVIESYPRGIAGFRSYLDLMATNIDIQDAPDAAPAPAFRGEITLQSVNFAYEDGPVLQDISLTVAPGQTVALVGPSGAGKSSLMALIPRFYEPQSGEVRIDGIPLKNMTLESLRGQIGLVSQEVFLFGGTLRDNITYGSSNATEEDISKAIEMAQLSAVVAGLPQGLETIVGERGVRLSGGQRQRVAIARVFLKNPPILLLDEATSALDRQTEREIQSALTKLAEGRSTLVIAHRLETIRHADKIYVMDKGKIVEEGNDADLRMADQHYARLVG